MKERVIYLGVPQIYVITYKYCSILIRDLSF